MAEAMRVKRKYTRRIPEPVPVAESKIKFPRPKPKFNLTPKRIVATAFAVLVGLSGYLYAQNRLAQSKIKQLSNPQVSVKAEVDALVNRVNKIVELPTGESPTVATVVDASKLKSQAFFANAANGDKVLMYIKAKKAYLYRPSINKLIEVSPIDIGSQAASAPAPIAAPASSTPAAKTTSSSTTSN